MEWEEIRFERITLRPHPAGWFNRYLSVVSVLLAIFVYFVLVEPPVVGYFRAKYGEEIAVGIKLLLFRHTSEELKYVRNYVDFEWFTIYIGLRHILRGFLIVLLSIPFRFKKKKAFLVWNFFITPIISFILPQEAPLTEVVQARLEGDIMYEDMKTYYNFLMKFLDIDQAFILSSIIFVGIYLIKTELERRGTEYILDPDDNTVKLKVGRIERTIPLEEVKDIIVVRHPLIKNCATVVFIEEGEDEEKARKKANDPIKSVYCVRNPDKFIEQVRWRLRSTKQLKTLLALKIMLGRSVKQAVTELEEEMKDELEKDKQLKEYEELKKKLERIIEDVPENMYA